jgi:hypothetical protein
MTVPETNEAQLVGLVRNALLVAGQEMGEEGDHWPVINSTIQSIMKDWEEVQIERNVFDEVKNQFRITLKELETLCQECPEEVRPQIRAIIIKLFEIYNACFTPVETNLYADEDTLPVHIKRAKAIIKTLEDDDA